MNKMPKTLAGAFPSLAGSGWRTSGFPSAAHDSFFFLIEGFFFLNGCVQIFYSGPVQQGFLDFWRFSDLKVMNLLLYKYIVCFSLLPIL